MSGTGSAAPPSGGAEVPVPVVGTGYQSPGQAPAPRQRRGSGASPWGWLEQLGQRFAFFEDPVGSALAVDRFGVAQSHGVVDGLGDVFGSDRFVGGVGPDLVGGALDLPASDASTGQQDTLGMRPVVAALTADASGSRVADLGLPAHLAVDHQQRLIE